MLDSILPKDSIDRRKLPTQGAPRARLGQKKRMFGKNKSPNFFSEQNL